MLFRFPVKNFRFEFWDAAIITHYVNFVSSYFRAFVINFCTFVIKFL